MYYTSSQPQQAASQGNECLYFHCNQGGKKMECFGGGGGGYCTREVYHENRPNLIKAHALPSHHTTLTCLLITPPTSMRKTYFDNPLSLRRWLFQNSCLIWYNREAEWPKCTFSASYYYLSTFFLHFEKLRKLKFDYCSILRTISICTLRKNFKIRLYSFLFMMAN